MGTSSIRVVDGTAMNPHDYAAYAQQQKPPSGVPLSQFPGYHTPSQFPQQQLPPSFLPPPHVHPHQPFPPLHYQQQQPQQPQFPFQRSLQPHLLHPQPFFPPSHPHPFFNAGPPPPSPPPADPELHKRIDKLIEYTAKNGPEFEAMIRDKQRDNPEYDFLFGGEGAGYYRYRLWIITHVPNNANSAYPPMNAPNFGVMPGPPTLHHAPFVGSGFYEQQRMGVLSGGLGR